MRYFDVAGVQDEIVDPNPEWMRTVYMPIACPRCKDVLPRHAGAIDVDVQTVPVGPTAGVDFPIRLELFRTDLFAVFQIHMPEFFFGSVRKKGVRVPEYVSVFAGDGARKKEYSDGALEYGPCSGGCGRITRRLINGNTWFRKSEVGDRLVFSSVGGGGTYVAESLIDRLSAGLRRELKLWPVEVRDK